MSTPPGGPATGQTPPYGIPRRLSPCATAVLCPNPSEMTFEGTVSYVLRAPGSATSVLVDPGPDEPRHHRVLAEEGSRVELVVVTHRHPDHTDGVGALHARVDAPVRAPSEAHCRGGAPLAGGEVLHAAGLELTVLATPGHTADSICLLVRPAGAPGPLDSIVLGDTILGRDSTVLDSTDGDLGDYLGSLDALARHGRGVLGLPGHGPEVADTAATAEALAAHRRDRLEQVRAARAELGPGADAAAITQRIYTDVSPFLLQVAEQSTRVALRYLERTVG